MKHTKFLEAIGARHRNWFQKNATLYLYILPIMSEIKGNTQLLSCITQKKSAASWVYTMFPQITQKIITADTYYWLEKITVILSIPKIFSLRKNNPSVFW